MTDIDAQARKEMGIDSEGNDKTITTEVERLRTVIVGLFDERTWLMLRMVLAVHFSPMFKNASNPLALVFVDSSSSGKTTVLDFCDELPMSLKLDAFTPASFLTQSANVKKKELENGKHPDLISLIPYRTLLLPELGVMFGQPKEILAHSYGVLARVLDGTGYSNAGGVHGLRSVKGDYFFGLCGASTPIKQTAWNEMGKVGNRLLLASLPVRERTVDRYSTAMKIFTSDSKSEYRVKVKKAKHAVNTYVEFVIEHTYPRSYNPPKDAPEGLSDKKALLDHCGYLPRILTWDPKGDDMDVLEMTGMLAEFVTACRAQASTWIDKDLENKTEVNSQTVEKEGIGRMAMLIKELLQAHAFACGRENITWDDFEVALTVGLSSIPDDIRKGVELLFDTNLPFKTSEKGKFTSNEMVDSTGVTRKTVLLKMTKLQNMGIGKRMVRTNRPDEFWMYRKYQFLLSEKLFEHYRKWDKHDDKLEDEELMFEEGFDMIKDDREDQSELNF